MKRIAAFVLIFLTIFLSACQLQEPVLTAVPEPQAETTVPATEEPAPEATTEVSEISAEAEMLDLGALVEQPWQWVSFSSPTEQFDVDLPQNYMLTFLNDGTVALVADCNLANGEYTAEGGALSIMIGPATLALCPGESRGEQFVTLLGGAARYFFEDGRLYIDLMADGGTMVFDVLEREGPPPPDEPQADADLSAELSTAVSVEALRNAVYSGIYEDPVTLVDGHYEGEPFAEGDAARPVVDVIDGTELLGDLDGDGADDAVVFLTENTGGTAVFTYVAAQLSKNGLLEPAGAALLGSRVQVKSATLQDGRLELEILTHGPDDAECCSTYRATYAYTADQGQLTQTAGQEAELTRVSAADLVGTTWALLELAEGQPVAPDSGITLNFGEGLVRGSGGCNSFNGIFSLGEDNPLTLTIGPLAATRQACPEPLGSQEDAYFAALESASEWGYEFGNLGLYYPDNQTDGLTRLLFVTGEQSPADVNEEKTMISETKPDYVLALEAAYGAPSQEGFGGAVFYEQAAEDGDLEETAQKYYQYFVGELWERWGEEAWMSPWKQVYARESGVPGDIISELRAIDDSDAAISVPLIVDVGGDTEAARKALADAFDAPEVSDLRVYNIGDGSAMSGLLVAGQRENGEVTILMALLD